jgi:hypothetical protein
MSRVMIEVTNVQGFAIKLVNLACGVNVVPALSGIKGVAPDQEKGPGRDEPNQVVLIGPLVYLVDEVAEIPVVIVV